MTVLSAMNYTYGAGNSNNRQVKFIIDGAGKIEAQVYDIATNTLLCVVNEGAITVDYDSASSRNRASMQARMGYPTTPLLGKKPVAALTIAQKRSIFSALGRPYKLDIENVPGAYHEEVSSIEVFNPT